MEILIYTLCCLLVLSYVFCKVLYIKLQNNNQFVNCYKRKEKEYNQKIEDLEINVKELLSELKKIDIELHDAHRIINSNEYIHDSYEATNLKIEMSKFSYENEKNLLLNKFMKDCISEFVIWNESPDKQNMIGELLVYVKKNNYENKTS